MGMDSKREDMRHVRLMMARQIVVVPLRLAKSLLVLPFLAPGQLMTLRLIQTVFSYVGRANLGAFSALAVYYPRADAAGNADEAARYATLAWRFAVGCSLLGAVVGGILACTSVEPWAILVLALWGACHVQFAFMQAGFQAKGWFPRLAMSEIVHAASGLLFPVAGVVLFGFDGFLVGCMLNWLVTIVYGRPWRVIERTTLSFDFAKRALVQGLQVWLNGSLHHFATTLEIMVIAAFLGADSSFGGQFAVATVLVAVVGGVMTGCHSVLARRVMRRLSKRPGDVRFALGEVFEATVLQFQLFIVSAAGLLIAIQVVPVWLPDYVPSLSLVAPLLAGHAAMRARDHYGVYFKFHERFRVIHIGHAVHLASVVGLSAGALLYGEPKWVAYGQAVGAFLGTLWVALGLLGDSRDRAVIGFAVRQMTLLGVIGAWLLVPAYGSKAVHDVALALAGGISVLLASFVLFPGSARGLWRVLRVRGR